MCILCIAAMLEEMRKQHKNEVIIINVFNQAKESRVFFKARGLILICGGGCFSPSPQHILIMQRERVGEGISHFLIGIFFCCKKKSLVSLNSA